MTKTMDRGNIQQLCRRLWRRLRALPTYVTAFGAGDAFLEHFKFSAVVTFLRLTTSAPGLIQRFLKHCNDGDDQKNHFSYPGCW